MLPVKIVLFCLWIDGRNCRQCDKVLHELENIDDETDHFGKFWNHFNEQKINLKTKYRHTHTHTQESILWKSTTRNSPSNTMWKPIRPWRISATRNPSPTKVCLTLCPISFYASLYYINQQFSFSLGDLLDEEQVLEFLTSLEAMDLPDQIEEVNAKILEKIVHDTGYIAVLFCK